MKKTGCLSIGLIPHQPSAPPAEPTSLPTELKEYYLEEFNVDLLKSVDFNPTEFAILPTESQSTSSISLTACTSDEVSNIAIPMYRIVTPEEEPAESQSTSSISPAAYTSGEVSNIAIPIYRIVTPEEEPAESTSDQSTTANTEVYAPVVEAVTPVKKVKKGDVSKVKNTGFKKHRSFPYPSLPPYPNPTDSE